jgi:hypothetical protein
MLRRPHRALGAVLYVLALLSQPPVAHPANANLTWDEPASLPTIPAGQRLVYTLYRRGAFETQYRRVRGFSIGGTPVDYSVSLTQDVGYVCYRVGVARAETSGSVELESSAWAEVQGYPGCQALCLRGLAPYPALGFDECSPPYTP